jgi:hypothetical protein
VSTLFEKIARLTKGGLCLLERLGNFLSSLRAVVLADYICAARRREISIGGRRCFFALLVQRMNEKTFAEKLAFTLRPPFE